MRMYRYVVDMLYSLAATVALFCGTSCCRRPDGRTGHPSNNKQCREDAACRK
jgi:hypothetical protein